jgi:hypothetical protein
MANNIMPGEHDWMYRQPGVMGFPTPAPTAQGGGLLDKIGGIFGGGHGGLLDPDAQKAAQRQALLAMSAQMLAAGGPSATRTSLGQALGQGIMAGQQAYGQAGNDMLQAMLLKTKLQTAGQTNAQKDYQYAVANGYKGTFEDWKRAGTKSSSGVQEYEYAKANGFTGTFEDWKRVGSARPTTPAAIQEYEYWKGLKTPEERDAYLTVKRSMQPYQLGEMGGGKVVFNRATGQYEQATSAAEEAAGAGQIAGATAAGKAAGEAGAQAQIDLPRMQDNATQALRTIEDFEKHPGFKYVFGWDSIAPTVPGSTQAGALAYYDQIKGKTFLEAFNSLKGAGQITEIEGQKGTDAIARLNRAQSEKDAKVALADLKEVIQAGLARAEKKAGAEPSKPSKRIRVDAQGNVIGN